MTSGVTQSSPTNETSVIIYSPSCHSKPVWLFFFCRTQKTVNILHNYLDKPVSIFWRTPWGCINDDRSFIFKWTVPLKGEFKKTITQVWANLKKSLKDSYPKNKIYLIIYSTSCWFQTCLRFSLYKFLCWTQIETFWRMLVTKQLNILVSFCGSQWLPSAVLVTHMFWLPTFYLLLCSTDDMRMDEYTLTEYIYIYIEWIIL